MSAPKDNDPISPAHYSRFKIQPIEFIVANALDFLAGNVIKYVCRHDAKNGLEDLKKARSYLDRMIAREEKRLKDQTHVQCLELANAFPLLWQPSTYTLDKG